MLIVGHRGARNEAPENTLAGFAFANRIGVDMVEFDVRISKDDQLVVIPAATVDRTTNGRGEVSDFTAAELGRLDARAQREFWPTPCGVPLFTDVLDVLGAIDAHVQMMIEIKQDAPAREERIVRGIVQQLHLRGLTERATITSFDPVALEIVQRAFPYQRRGYIGAWDRHEFLETALRLGCAQGDANHATSSSEMIAAAQDAGLAMVGWPCNSREVFDLLLAGWGVDAITTDQPTMILSFRDERDHPGTPSHG